jgi:hypothetical protein
MGLIRDILDVKILTLYILARLPEPTDFETLYTLTQCDDGVTYFDFTESLDGLIGTEHVSLDGGRYAATEKGARNGKITENTLPYSVRLKADRGLVAHRVRLSRAALIKTSRELRRRGGYTVRLSMSDGLDELVSLSLFAMSEPQAELLESGFKSRAEGVYTEILKLILREGE